MTARAESAAPVAIVCDQGVSFAEKLAAKEVRRYVYLRTGKLLPIVVTSARAETRRAPTVLDRRRQRRIGRRSRPCCPMPS